MMRITSMGAALATMMLAACDMVNNDDAETRFPDNLAEHRFPLVPTANWTVIEGAINGQDGYLFLVDSGATLTALFDHPKLDALSLEKTGSIRINGVGKGKGSPASFVDDVGLSFGPVRLEGLRTVLIDAASTPIFKSPEGIFIDGIIGWDLLRRFAIDADVEDGVLRLHPRGQVPDLDALPAGSLRLPLRQKGRFVYATLPVIAADNSLIDAEFVVDTGNSGTAMILNGSHPSLKPSADAQMRSITGLAGDSDRKLGTISGMQLGKVELQNIPVSFGDAAHLPGSGKHGNLGSGILARFRYIIDLESLSLTLIPKQDSGRPYPPATDYDMALLPVGYPRDRFQIYQIDGDADALAQAGLIVQPGDMIRTINGLGPSDAPWRRFQSILAGQEGSSLEICLDDAGTPNCQVLTLPPS